MSAPLSSDPSSNHRKTGSNHELERFLPGESNQQSSSSSQDAFYRDDDPAKLDDFESDLHVDEERFRVDDYSDDELDLPPRKYSPGWLGTVSRFLDGPVPPRQPFVSPIFRTVQYFPATISKRWPYRLKLGIVVSFLSCWFLIFYQLARHSILETPRVNGAEIPLLSCSATHAVWSGKNQRCGINGTQCGAQHLQDFIFKCPASCREDSYTWSETAVANYSTIYRPYVIGGDNKYRADSFLCASALHHGVSGNRRGFCSRIVFKGETRGFPGVKGKSNIESLPFDSLFPQSFEFDDEFNKKYSVSGCRDLRMSIITFNIVMSFIFGYIIQRGDVFYWVFVIMGFWTVVLAANPPFYGGSGDFIAAELLSLGFRRFMPYMFGCYVIWAASARGQLVGLKESLSRAVFWVPGFWVSLLENYTFSALPVNRLTVHDINTQRGGWITVISIAGFILFAAFGQAFIIWRLGKFKRYITIYIGMILALVILGGFKNETLRLHHYILGLLLLPGVGFKTTPSLLFSGLLLGLYISGVARWDFDSIIQTEAQLNRGDATNVGGLPELIAPIVEYANATDIIDGVSVASERIADIFVQWKDLLSDSTGVNSAGQADGITTSSTSSSELASRWDGYSLIVNDVEQYRGNATSFSIKHWLESWGPSKDDNPQNLYVRLAFVNEQPGRESTGDYSKAGVIDLSSGEWTVPLPGPS